MPQPAEATPFHKEVLCAYCAANVVGSAFVVCAACDVPAHADCWSEAGRCSTYACGSERALDPAIALYRASRQPVIAAAAEPAAAEPTAAAPSAAAAPEPRGALTRHIPDALTGLLLGRGPSLVAIDVNLGEPHNWLAALRSLFSRPARVAPPAPMLSPERARHEIKAVSSELTALRMRRWLRMIGLIGMYLMMPLVLRLISKILVLPMVLGSIIWLTWPGWNLKGSFRRERALEARLKLLPHYASGDAVNDRNP